MSAPLRVFLRLADGDDHAVGRLAERRGRVFFEWDAEARRWPLSPLAMPWREGVIEGPREPFGGLLGLFADSLPDAWGTLLTDRAMRRQGENPATLTVLDRLALVGAGGAGALVYRPERSVPYPPARLSLDELAEDAVRILEGEETEGAALDRLQGLGGSAGGARPKALVWRDGTGRFHGKPGRGRTAWIVKFPAPGDGDAAGAVEAAYAVLARRAGLEMADTMLAPSAVSAGWFATERFDRIGEGRVHMLSLSALLEAEWRISSVGYDMLMKVTRRITGDERAAEDAFRLMAFNVATHNRDDHAKNVAFLMEANGTWRLAPAFDLTRADGPGGEHTMDVAGEGKAPTRTDALRAAGMAGLKRTRAVAILDAVADALKGAEEPLDDAGVPRRKRKDIVAMIEKGRHAIGSD